MRMGISSDKDRRKKTHSIRRALAPKRSHIKVHLRPRVEHKPAPYIHIADPDLPAGARPAGLNVNLAVGSGGVDVGARDGEGVEAERDVVKTVARLVDGGGARRAPVATVLHRRDVRQRRGGVPGVEERLLSDDDGGARYHGGGQEKEA